MTSSVCYHCPYIVPLQSFGEERTVDATADTPETVLASARSALSRGAWQEARLCFRSALEFGERPDALEGLGKAAYQLDDVATVLASHERAYVLYRDQDDARSAARMALALGSEYADFQGDLAAADGWFQRARRLLDGLSVGTEHGWLTFWEGFLALWLNDAVGVHERAAQTAAIGRTLRALDLEMLGLALDGLGLVWEGAVADGMRHLDEAATAAVVGEMQDLSAISTICCATLYACNWVADYDRAERWAARVKAFSDRRGLDPLFAFCRLNHASVHLWRGAWMDAEADLIAATQALEATRPPYYMEGAARLAELRRRQGRVQEAQEMLDRAEAHPLSLFVKAALELDRKNPAVAAHLIGRFLRQVTQENRAARVFAYGIQLSAELAQGRAETTGAILDAMGRIAHEVNTLPLRASVRAAEGMVAAASGENEQARLAFEDAFDLFIRSGSAYEASRVRLHLANCLRAAGEEGAAAEEIREALSAFHALGAAPEAARAERLLAELQVRARTSPEITDPDGLTPREIEVLRLIAAGRSNQQIASDLVLSVRTVERHISNLYTKLSFTGKVGRAAAAAYAISHHLT
jgi:LuxR family transcriptional regulator, maltose regulon positive regulatory protein